MFYFHRWKISDAGEKVIKNGKPVLEFLAAQYSNNKEWAIPEVSFVHKYTNAHAACNLVCKTIVYKHACVHE